MAKKDTVIVDSWTDYSEKCYKVMLDGVEAFFPKSVTEHDGGNQFATDAWRIRKLMEAAEERKALDPREDDFYPLEQYHNSYFCQGG